METVKEFTLKFEWVIDGRWLVTCDNIHGVMLVANSFQEALDVIGSLVTQLMEANDQEFPCDNHGNDVL